MSGWAIGRCRLEKRNLTPKQWDWCAATHLEADDKYVEGDEPKEEQSQLAQQQAPRKVVPPAWWAGGGGICNNCMWVLHTVSCPRTCT